MNLLSIERRRVIIFTFVIFLFFRFYYSRGAFVCYYQHLDVEFGAVGNVKNHPTDLRRVPHRQTAVFSLFFAISARISCNRRPRERSDRQITTQWQKKKAIILGKRRFFSICLSSAKWWKKKSRVPQVSLRVISTFFPWNFFLSVLASTVIF